MQDFTRARSEEQKRQRMQEIKTAAETLFKEHPYHEITLTTIAEQLSWMRANLYKYVGTKEEIFLELYADKMHGYFDALQAAFPAGCEYSLSVRAEVWACILNAHCDYLHYGTILTTIIETNVSVERLSNFKSQYYRRAKEWNALLGGELNIPEKKAEILTEEILYDALGLESACRCTALVEQAMARAGIERCEVCFKTRMKEFILMCLWHATQAPQGE